MKKKNLIYDVGLHKGEDTDFYLKKGFNVVAFEANPDLVKDCKERFINELQTGQLVIVEGAIVDFGTDIAGGGNSVKFFRNNNSVWGTVVESWAKRNEMLGTENEIIEVPAINFSECLQKYGIPHYLKIDIEGMDMVCLKSLLNFKEKPNYISIESEKIRFNALKEEFEMFKQLGYSSFQVVNQANVNQQKEPKNSQEGKFCNYAFLRGATGLFGKDLPNNWLNEKDVLKRYEKIFLWYKLFGDYGIFGRKNRVSWFIFRVIRKFAPKLTKSRWYDTHARLEN